MTRPLYQMPHASQCGCMPPAAMQAAPPCRAALAGLGYFPEPDPAGTTGLQTFFGDWKNIALIAAGALVLMLVMQTTGPAAVRKVRRMKARSEYRAALKRIKEQS